MPQHGQVHLAASGVGLHIANNGGLAFWFLPYSSLVILTLILDKVLQRDNNYLLHEGI